MHEVVILTGQAPSNQFMSRFAGPYRLATELRQNDIPTMVINGFGYYSLDTLIEICDQYITENTLVLGISTTFFVDYAARFARDTSKLYYGDRFRNDILELTKHYKSVNPKLKIVVGGPSARTKLSDLSVIDLIIEGYADDILVNYVKSLKGQSKRLFFDNYHQNVPFLSNPYGSNFVFRNSTIRYQKDDCIMHGETLPLELSRGCIFKCRFCSYPMRGKPKNDTSFLKDENIVYDELLENYERFGTTSYIFVDDTFNDSVPKMESLYNVFNKLPFKLNFGAYIRPDLLDAYPETIDMLYEMGIRGAFFGIESLHDSARKIILKGFNSQKLLQTIEVINKKWQNVAITSSFIYGLPNDTLATMNQWTDTIFNSGLFDNHDLIFQPLYLLGKSSTYASDFDMDMEKFNYRYKEGYRSWVNDYTSFQEVFEMSKVSNSKATESKRPFSSFHCVTLLGYGLSMDEILSLNGHSKQDIEKIENMTIEKYNDYLELLRWKK